MFTRTYKCSLLGALDSSHPDFDRIAAEAARTIPGRENGGNCDIKNLTKGCRIYFPVFVEGALLSMGDIHFSQGDGEVSFCGAIEISGRIDLKCDIIRGGMKQYMDPVGPSELNVNPIFEVSPMDGSRWFSEWLVFEGLSIDENGKQHFMDASIAYKRAGRIAGIVDVPNACATLAIPTAIFDQDVRPQKGGIPPSGVRLVHRGQLPQCT
eukprot:jgi/Picre1/29793/NNA_005175.t1